MEQFKKLVRDNKKLVALIVAAALTFGGVKLAPETTEALVNTIVEVCCKEELAPVVDAQPHE